MKVIRCFVAAILLFNAGTSRAFDFTCGDRIIAPGAAKIEVLGACGEPLLKEQREEFVEESDKKGKKREVRTVEEWTYDLGPDQFTSLLKFVNGPLLKSAAAVSVEGMPVPTTVEKGSYFPLGIPPPKWS